MPDVPVLNGRAPRLGGAKGRAFARFLPKAVDLLTERVPLLKVLREATTKLGKEGGMDRVKADVALLVRFVKAWAREEYRGVPWRTLVYAVGALLYFVSPVDLIPDWIPVLGLTDDVAVVVAVVRAIRKDLDRFARWEAARLGTPLPAPKRRLFRRAA